MREVFFIPSTKQTMLTTVAVTALLGTAAPGWAQSLPPGTAAAPDAAAQTPDGDIVVTGSRIARRDYDSASPIVTLSRNSSIGNPA